MFERCNVRVLNLLPLLTNPGSGRIRGAPSGCLHLWTETNMETKKELLCFQGGIKHASYTVAHETHEIYIFLREEHHLDKGVMLLQVAEGGAKGPHTLPLIHCNACVSR